uniref:Uncharacterized protein n=1 Tax=Oryza nivara TaxID=4536 RepID=A0A0E0GIS6_ORYNI
MGLHRASLSPYPPAASGSEYDKSLSEYSLHRNSTIEICYRGRVGRPMTFYKKVDDTDANTWFSTVNLVPALQTQSHTNPLVVPWLSVSYFLDFASYNIQKVLNHVTATHRENLSYNGAFTSANITFHNGVVTIQGFRTKTQINHQETRLERFCDRILDSGMYERCCIFSGLMEAFIFSVSLD